MNVIELRETTRRRMLPGRRRRLFAVAILQLVCPLAAVAAEPAAAPEPAAAADDDAADDIISLAAYNVKADRIEDFGLRIDSVPYPDASRLLTNATFWFAKYAPLITTVVPNTAAAKAGLQPNTNAICGRPRSEKSRRVGRWR